MTLRSLFVTFVGLLACGTNASGPQEDIQLSLRLDRTTLVPGEQTSFTVTLTRDGVPASAEGVSVLSEAPDIATVTAAGFVSAVKPGRVTITATIGASFSQAQLTVAEGGVVTQAGGTVRLTSGRVEITLPPGAVSGPTAITIVAAAPPMVDPTVVKNATFEIGPSSLALSAPATLKITYSPANAPIGLPQRALGLRRASNVTWVDLATSMVDSTTGSVTAGINHGGTYSVGRLVATEPCNAPEDRYLDFWIGQWDMTQTASGQSVGTSTITMEPGGCVIYEEYVSPTPISPGRSISFYEPNTNRWYQNYIDAGGNPAELASLSFSPTAIVMRTTDPTTYSVVSWTRIDANTVRQVSDFTPNGGVTFFPDYNLTYRRRAALRRVGSR